MRFWPQSPSRDRKRGSEKLSVARRATQRERPADIRVQLLKKPAVRNRSRNVLAEKTKKRAEGSGHREDLGHVFLLLSREKKILRFVGKPQVAHWRIVRPGEDGLADIGEHEALQKQTHAARDGRPGAIHEDDLALVLQTAKIRCRGA